MATQNIGTNFVNTFDCLNDKVVGLQKDIPTHQSTI
jgi:hypothetical protein